MPMTVAELIAKLASMPPDSIVVMSSDAEGNTFGPLNDVDPGLYEAESSWQGYYSDPDRDEDAEGVPCVGLWPVR